MVDPINFTNYYRSDNELEETLLFSILVAGKNAVTTARMLEEMLVSLKWNGGSPFSVLFSIKENKLISILKKSGFGCYNNKGKGIYQLVHTPLNLRTCSIDELECIRGIGRKTSRLFVLHTRPDAKCIPLDVHILHYLNDLGFKDVPRVTPSSRNKYITIENICIQLAKNAGKSCADWDLEIWRLYRDKAARKAS